MTKPSTVGLVPPPTRRLPARYVISPGCNAGLTSKQCAVQYDDPSFRSHGGTAVSSVQAAERGQEVNRGRQQLCASMAQGHRRLDWNISLICQLRPRDDSVQVFTSMYALELLDKIPTCATLNPASTLFTTLLHRASEAIGANERCLYCAWRAQVLATVSQMRA